MKYQFILARWDEDGFYELYRTIQVKSTAELGQIIANEQSIILSITKI